MEPDGFAYNSTFRGPAPVPGHTMFRVSADSLKENMHDVRTKSLLFESRDEAC